MIEITINLTNHINNFKITLFGMIIDFFHNKKNHPMNLSNINEDDKNAN
jgi:hypothetical protein